MSEKIKVDAMGDACPIPVVKAKKALDHATEGTVIEVHVDNEIAVQNLMKMAKSQSSISQSRKEGERHFVVRMWMEEGAETLEAALEAAPKSAVEAVTEPAREESSPAAAKRPVVVISSATMGVGNDSLGSVLMKGFLYALSKMDSLPEKILFYNGGVKWTTEESETLEDLKSMEAQGVEILSCGTCLDYYRCADKLLVGDVTNMYSIVEAMTKAGNVIRP